MVLVAVSLLSFHLPETKVNAYHGRTEGECNRINDPEDRSLCLEHAQDGSVAPSCIYNSGTPPSPSIVACSDYVDVAESGLLNSRYYRIVDEGIGRASVSEITEEDFDTLVQDGRQIRGENAGNNELQAGNLDAECSDESRVDTSKDALHPDNCGIVAYIKIFTDALSVLLGVVVVMMIVVGGIRYASAGSNPQAVASAKQHISSALLALVLYLFMFAFLQWIVPGGVL